MRVAERHKIGTRVRRPFDRQHALQVAARRVVAPRRETHRAQVAGVGAEVRGHTVVREGRGATQPERRHRVRQEVLERTQVPAALRHATGLDLRRLGEASAQGAPCRRAPLFVRAFQQSLERAIDREFEITVAIERRRLLASVDRREALGLEGPVELVERAFEDAALGVERLEEERPHAPGAPQQQPDLPEFTFVSRVLRPALVAFTESEAGLADEAAERVIEHAKVPRSGDS